MGEEANISLGDVNARLGLTMSAAFVMGTLGIAPAKRVRRAILFTESQFGDICGALSSHVSLVRIRNASGLVAEEEQTDDVA